MPVIKIAIALLLLPIFVGVAGASSFQVESLADAKKELMDCSDPEEATGLFTRVVARYTKARPNPDVVAILSESLDHSLVNVRCLSAAALGGRVSTADAVPLLVRAFATADEEGQDLARQAEKLGEDFTGHQLSQDFGAAMKNFTEVMKLSEQHAQLTEFRTALLVGAMSHEDDRCIAAVASVMPGYVLSDLNMVVAEFLFESGTQASIDAVVGSFDDIEEVMVQRSKERKAFLRAKSPPRPDGYRQTNSEWRASVKEKKEEAVAKHDVKTAELEGIAEEYCKFVRGVTVKSGLKGAPRKPKASAWKSWWKRQRSNFPATLSAANEAPTK